MSDIGIIRKAVFPAAGLGTRFLPATKNIPKEMIPLLDRPCIQWAIEEAAHSGLTDVVLISARGKGSIEDHFDRDPELERVLASRGKDDALRAIKQIAEMCTVSAIRQDEPRGLGHAVLTARPIVGNEWFAVLLGDDIVHTEKPFVGQMVEYARRHNSAVVALQRVPMDRVSRYGVVKADDLGDGGYRITDMVEKPPREEAPSDLAVVGRYVLPPEVFEILARTKPGAGGEIQLTDALKELAHEGRMVGLEIHGRRLDTGNPLGLLEAQLYLGLRHPEFGPRIREIIQSVMDGGMEDDS